MIRQVWVVVLLGTGCWTTAGPPAGSSAGEVTRGPDHELIPVTEGERILEAAAAASPPGRSRLEVSVIDAVGVGDPIDVGLRIDGMSRTMTAEVTLTGKGVVEHHRVPLHYEPPGFQGCDPVHDPDECRRDPPRGHMTSVRLRPLRAVGEYRIQARVDDPALGAEHAVAFRVVSPRLLRAYRVLPFGGLGSFALRARAVVETTQAGRRIVVSRGVYERSGALTIADVTEDLSEQPGLLQAIGHELRGMPTRVGLHTVFVDRGHFATWVSSPMAAHGQVAVRISGDVLEDLALIEGLARMHQPVRSATSAAPPGPAPPVRPPPGGPPPVSSPPVRPSPVRPRPLLNTAPPGTCNADAHHCCDARNQIVRPGGCEPSYPDGVVAGMRRGSDGFCEPVECHLRCLPGDARIATPDGQVAVSALRAGDRVWTVSSDGARISAAITQVTSVPIVGAHAVVELVLADGRSVRGSAGHPLSTGPSIGTLRVGATLDGSTVVSIRAVAVHGATWDLLPDGPTGAYWADGVLLGSTLGQDRAGSRR